MRILGIIATSALRPHLVRLFMVSCKSVVRFTAARKCVRRRKKAEVRCGKQKIIIITSFPVIHDADEYDEVVRYLCLNQLKKKSRRVVIKTVE